MQLTFQEHHLFQILRRFDNQHLPLDLFLSQYFRAHKALGAKDRRTISETIYDMIRWRGLIDYLLGQETSWERRYEVYRAFQPQNYLYVQKIPPHIRVSAPPELFSLLQNQYGLEKAIELCQVCNTQAPVTIRINPMKTTRSEMLHRFAPLDGAPTELSPYGIVFKKRHPFFEMPEFKEGLFEVQDEGSQRVAELIQAKPGDHVLDYCAGAGGKTLAFAHKLQGQGQIYLHDIRPAALEQAKRRLKRAGIQNAQYLVPGHPTLATLVGKIDWVVVDAPCTGTGTLRRNPDMKWKFSLEQLYRLVEEQRMIVKRALSYLKEGGHLVYITCSILKEENEEQLAFFRTHYNLEVITPPTALLPTLNGADGFFGALLKKIESK